jgi:outer membrane protein insertion porin family
MNYRRQVTATFFNSAVALSVIFMLVMSACVVPKDFQKNKPFVYKTEIKVSGDLPNDQREDLVIKLNNQLDDSLRVRTVTGLTIAPPFFRQKLSHPPVFDSANLVRSVGFMIDLMNSIGYYAPVIKDTFEIDTLKKNNVSKREMRTTIKFNVSIGKNLKFDSIGFALTTPSLQNLTIKTKDQSLLKKGNPYSKQIVSAELDRLVDLFRNNGYYKISRDDLFAERDTVEAALIDPTLDVFQQAKLLEDLKKKREKPTVNLVIKQRPVDDSDRIKKYYIGNITIFPDLPVLEDTAVAYKNDTTKYDHGITIISRSDVFNDQFLMNNVFFQQGQQYKLDTYNRTLTRFNNQLTAWQQAAIDLNESDSSDSVLDATLRLYPALKQSFRVSLEGSYNSNELIGTNLFGTDVSLTHENKNAFKKSIRTTTSISGGVEFGEDFIQSTQAGFSHTIYFPRLNAPQPFAVTNKLWQLSNAHTVVNFSASYTRRLDLFTFRSIDASYGYEWTITNKQKNLTHSFLWRPINIEYAILSNITDSFRNTYLDKFPSLYEAFKTGLVVGAGFGQVIYTRIQQSGIHTNHFRISAEESGTLAGLVDAFDKGELLRFVKGDIDYWHHFDYRKTELAMHVYAGAGREYGEGKGVNQVLPFYKAFWAGGPNSMRGWSVRQLGYGSNDTSKYGGIDRFGDVQVEGNIEYRFPLGTLFNSVKLKSAIYTDVGNIWDWTDSIGKGSDFKLNRFYKELGVDVGTGLRFDFDTFLIRLDWAYKVRDPQALYPNRWFYDFDWKNGQFQLGIGLPF